MNKKMPAEERKHIGMIYGMIFGIFAGTIMGILFKANIGAMSGIGLCFGLSMGALYDARTKN